MRFKADRQALSPAGESPEFVEGLLIWRESLRKPVVLRLDEVIETLRAVFVYQARQLIERDRLTQLGLGQ